jgi:hypothetical protein
MLTLTAPVTDELIKEIDAVSQRLDRSREFFSNLPLMNVV